MFCDINEFYFGEKGKIIKYHEVQTSQGQSGAPIILKQGDTYQVVGVHTGHGNLLNMGTFIESLTYETFTQIFCEDSIDKKK